MCYAKFLVRENCLHESFLDKARKIKPRRHKPPKRRTLTTEQIELLMEECKNPYERSLILLLSTTGIRASECAALRIKHLDLEEGTLTVECGKGGRRRVVGFIPELAEELKCLLNTREELIPDEPVFISRLRQPLSRHGVGLRVRRIGRRAWIDVSPHDLRRSFVTINAHKGISFDMLQLACGHAYIDTTRAYCQTNEAELVKSMRTWRLNRNLMSD